MPPAGLWSWDIEWTQADLLLAGSGSWKVFYCPGTRPRFDDQNNWELWNFRTNVYRVLGYSQTLVGSDLIPTNWNPSIIPQMMGTNAPQPASDRVLAADSTLCAGGTDPALVSTYNWTKVKGGYWIPHISPHMRGSIPLGGNLLMLDGHVEWRKFERMLPRNTTPDAPIYWW